MKTSYKSVSKSKPPIQKSLSKLKPHNESPNLLKVPIVHVRFDFNMCMCIRDFDFHMLLYITGFQRSEFVYFSHSKVFIKNIGGQTLVQEQFIKKFN